MSFFIYFFNKLDCLLLKSKNENRKESWRHAPNFRFPANDDTDDDDNVNKYDNNNDRRVDDNPDGDGVYLPRLRPKPRDSLVDQYNSNNNYYDDDYGDLENSKTSNNNAPLTNLEKKILLYKLLKRLVAIQKQKLQRQELFDFEK